MVCRCWTEKEREVIEWGRWPPGHQDWLNRFHGVANKRTLFHGRSFWTRLGSWYSKQEKQNRNKLTVTNFEDQQIMTTGAAAALCQSPYCLQILNIICHPGSKLLGIVWLKDISGGKDLVVLFLWQSKVAIWIHGLLGSIRYIDMSIWPMNTEPSLAYFNKIIKLH